MAMSNPFQQYQQGYDTYDDRELRMRARSREEYEYLKRQRDIERQYAMQNIMPPPVTVDAPKAKPSHLNTKLLLTKGA